MGWSFVKVRQPYASMPAADIDGDGDGDGLRATIRVAAEDGDRAVIAYAPDAPVPPDWIDFAHEAAHVLRGQDNDAMHHPWWHCCGLVGHTVRFRWHLTKQERDVGRRLHAAKVGEVVYP